MNEGCRLWPTTVRLYKLLRILPQLYFLLSPPHFHLSSPQFTIDPILQVSHTQKHPQISKRLLGLKWWGLATVCPCPLWLAWYILVSTSLSPPCSDKSQASKRNKGKEKLMGERWEMCGKLPRSIFSKQGRKSHGAHTSCAHMDTEENDWKGGKKKGGEKIPSDVNCYPIKLKINSPERWNPDTGISHSVRSLRHLFTTWHKQPASGHWWQLKVGKQ